MRLYHLGKISLWHEDGIEEAEVVVMTYGISSRVSMPAIREARRKGVKVGHLRLLVVWPFPQDLIRRMAEKIRAFVVPELNLGQVALEVERCAAGKCDVISVPHAGGAVHSPEVICRAIVEAAG